MDGCETTPFVHSGLIFIISWWRSDEKNKTKPEKRKKRRFNHNFDRRFIKMQKKSILFDSVAIC